MTDKVFNVVKPQPFGNQDFLYGAGFAEFSDLINGRAINFVINRGYSYVVPVDGIKLGIDYVSLPIKCGKESQDQKLMMTESFLIQLLNILGFTPKMLDSVPHDLMVEAANRKMSTDITRHLKVHVSGRTALSVVNPKYTYVHPYDTVCRMEKGNTHNPNTAREWRMACGWLDIFGTIRSIWYFPKCAADIPGHGTVFGAAELIMNNYMTCHPTVTPCIYSSSGIAVLRSYSSQVLPTGTVDQANSAIAAKIRRCIIDTKKYLDIAPQMSNMRLSKKEAERLNRDFKNLGVSFDENLSWVQVFRKLFAASSSLNSNQIRAREVHLALGDMFEVLNNEYRGAKVQAYCKD